MPYPNEPQGRLQQVCFHFYFLLIPDCQLFHCIVLPMTHDIDDANKKQTPIISGKSGKWQWAEGDDANTKKRQSSALSKSEKSKSTAIEPTEKSIPNPKSSKVGGSFNELLKQTLHDIDHEDKTPSKPPDKLRSAIQSTKKRKTRHKSIESDDIEPSAKRMKMMEPKEAARMETLQEILLSRKGNLIGTLYVADIIGVNKNDGYFKVNAECKGLSHIPDGILPFLHLCDSAPMSMQLSLSIINLLELQQTETFMEYGKIPVLLFDISENGMPVFTAKNMLVSHVGDCSFPRSNAYQMSTAYRSIQREIPMIGTIRNVNIEGDTMSIVHRVGVESTVDHSNCLLEPFHHKEVTRTLECGQTVIGHVDNNCKLEHGKLKLLLSRLDTVKREDIIASNTSFMTDYANVICLKSKSEWKLMSKKSTKHVVHSGLSIGDVVDVTVSKVTPTLIHFESDNGYHGLIARPEHSGSELNGMHCEMKTKVLILDIDVSRNQLVGSIRLSHKSAIDNDDDMEDGDIWEDEEGVPCTVEWVSDNGYLVLQIVSNRQFVLVPIDTPYFHFTFIQRHNIYFKVGQQFNVQMIGEIAMDLNHYDSEDNVERDPQSVPTKPCSMWLGHIPSWIGRGGYIATKMKELIANPKLYRPYDWRFRYPAQIIFNENGPKQEKPNPIRYLKVKFVKTTAEGHIAEIAPDFYPKIIIPPPPEDDALEYVSFLDLKERVDQKEMIRVHINEDLSRRVYSNGDREIHISMDDVCDQFDEFLEKKLPQVIDDSPLSRRLKVGQIVTVDVISVSPEGISVHIVRTMESEEKEEEKVAEEEKRNGFVLPQHVADSIEGVESAMEGMHVDFEQDGRYKAVVLDVSDPELIQLSLQQSVKQRYSKMQDMLTHRKVLKLDKGLEVLGVITKIVNHHGLFVDIGVFGIAQVHITNTVKTLNGQQRIDLDEMFSVDQVIRTRVIAISSKPRTIELSLRHVAHPNVPETPLKHNEVIKGSLVSGIVSRVDANLGVIVWLSRTIKGRLSFTKMGPRTVSYDAAVRNFPIGRVLHDVSVLFSSPLHHRVKRVELGMSRNSMRFVSHKLEDLDVGDFMTVKFHKQMKDDHVVFVPSSDFRIGIIPEAESAVPEDERHLMIKGDQIQVWVLEVREDEQTQKKTVIFTMKSSSVQSAKSSFDFGAAEKEEQKKRNQQRLGINLMREFKKLQELKRQKGTAKKEEEIEDKKEEIKDSKEDSQPPQSIDDSDSEEDDDDIKPLVMNPAALASVRTVDAVDEIKVRLDDTEYHRKVIPIPNQEKDEVDQVVTKLAREVGIESKKKLKKKEIEKRIQEIEAKKGMEAGAEWRELQRAEGLTKKPKGAKEFEKLLVSSPNSSIIWIEYMASYLAKKNVVKARQVVRQALDRIAFGEGKERLNMWIAWMNLEMLYGSEEMLLSVFQKALKRQNAKDVYTQFVGVLRENGKWEMATQYLTEMLHKFRKSSDVYVTYGHFLYERFRKTKGKTRRDHLFSARDILKRGIQNLKQKTQHISLIKKFAYFEYKYVLALTMQPSVNLRRLGFTPKGARMFEGLLKKHGDNTGLWQAYALCVHKFGGRDHVEKLDNARNVFERAVLQNMKTKQKKQLFKAYLDFEIKNGNRSLDHKQNVEHIKDLAREFVENINKIREQGKRNRELGVAMGNNLVEAPPEKGPTIQKQVEQGLLDE